MWEGFQEHPYLCVHIPENSCKSGGDSENIHVQTKNLNQTNLRAQRGYFEKVVVDVLKSYDANSFPFRRDVVDALKTDDYSYRRDTKIFKILSTFRKVC